MVLSEKFYQSLIQHIINAFAYHKIITDEKGKPVDYEFIEVNKYFEEFTGLKRENVIGKRVKEVISGIEEDEINWVEFYGDIALNRKSVFFEQYSAAFDKWYFINAYSIESGYFCTIFIDISSLKQKELELQKNNAELTSLYEEQTSLYEEIAALEEELRQQIEQVNALNMELSESRRRLSKAQEIAHVGNWEVNLKTGELWASEEAFRLHGMDGNSPMMAFGKTWSQIHEEDRKKLLKAITEMIRKDKGYDITFRIIRADNGEIRYMRSVAELERDQNGRPSRALKIIHDITDRVKYEQEFERKNEELTALYEEITASEEELRQQLDELQRHKEMLELSEERYRTLVDNSEDVIFSCDTNGVFTAVNRKFCEELSLKAKDIIGKKLFDFMDNKEEAEKWNRDIMYVIASGEKRVVEDQRMVRGDKKHLIVTISPLKDKNKKVLGATVTTHDITSLKQHEETIVHMAYHDPLTGLPNRRLFVDRMKNALSLSKRNKTKAAVVFMDLDNFKEINDTLGHLAGDRLLVDVSKRILSYTRDYDTVARLSGDEFSLLIPDIVHIDEVIYIIERIKSLFDKPFMLNETAVNLTASIGVSIYPDDSYAEEELIKYADTAMYKAKAIGKNCYQLYDINMKEELLRKINIERMLREALNNNEFVLYYQPQYYTQTKQLRGFEALIRWSCPNKGFLSPADFIPTAEKTGLIVPIGEWVLNTACRVCREIQDRYGRKIIISVNISPIQLREKDFDNTVMRALNNAGLDASSLELEITENIFIDNYDIAAGVLQRIKDMGIRIALDDFGSGYSSLGYLKKLPISLLKIDKAFIDQIDPGASQADITDSIISLMHKLKILTLAEGVETEEQYEYLKKSNCDFIQGYYVGKPVSKESLGSIIEGASGEC
jgi:diguanylate cyclase (GGDEF)-like protein/PAS domain S-box-containing protein